jgi:uncharacterized protein DUF3667
MSDPAASRGTEHCVTCSAATETPYCPYCGQQRATPLTFPTLARSALDGLADLDRGLLFTFRELTRRPGAAIASYLEGRSCRYTGPVKYAFIAASAFGMVSLILPAQAGQEDVVEMIRAISGPWAYAIFLSGLGLAVLQRLLFPHALTSVAETYAFQLYVLGHLTWVTLAWLLLSSLAPVSALEPVERIVEVGYVVLALRGLTGAGYLRVAGSGLLLWFAWKVLTITILLAVMSVTGGSP